MLVCRGTGSFPPWCWTFYGMRVCQTFGGPLPSPDFLRAAPLQVTMVARSMLGKRKRSSPTAARRSEEILILKQWAPTF